MTRSHANTGRLPSIRAGAMWLALAAVVSACDPSVPNSGAPAPVAGEGLPPNEAQTIVGQIFYENGCKMTMADYSDALDLRGYDPETTDITTPGGHLTMVNRAILESTPLTLVDDDLFARSGSTLTSKIGGCADAPSPIS